MPAVGENRREIQRRYKERHPEWWRQGDQEKRRARQRAYNARKRERRWFAEGVAAEKLTAREEKRVRAELEREAREMAAVEAFLERWNAREDERVARRQKRRVFWKDREEFYRLIGL